MKHVLGDPDILPFDTSHKDLPVGALAVASATELVTPHQSRGDEPDHTHVSRADDAPSRLLYSADASDGGPSAGGEVAQYTAVQRAAVHGGPDSLAFWALHYLERYRGGSPNTLDAKARDLRAFFTWFAAANGLTQIRAWRTRDTRGYLGSLERAGRAATTINRHIATLRNFARWAHNAHGVFGAMGLPTDGIKDFATEAPPCKKIDRSDMRALFKAAEERVALMDFKRQDAAGTGRSDPVRRKRPRRDLAMLGLLYYTGIRAAELVALTRAQYTGTHLRNVARKGQVRSRRIYVPAEARRMLDDYLQTERQLDAAGEGAPAAAPQPLFLSTRSGGYMRREYLDAALKRIAEDASKHRGAAGIQLHAHRLRHTFGARHRETSGSDTETAEALGHQSLKYVGRYVRKTDEEREALIERALDT